jgi:AraC-like DNA-binding protein
MMSWLIESFVVTAVRTPPMNETIGTQAPGRLDNAGIFARTEDPWDHSRSPGGVALLCQFAVRNGVEPAMLLDGSGISDDVVADPNAYISAYAEVAVIRNLIRALDRAGLGVEMGREYHLTAYGYFGYLLVNCASMLEVVNDGLRFIALTFAFSTMSARLSDAGNYVFAFDTDHVPDDIRRFVVERDVAAFLQMQRELLPHIGPLPLRAVSFAFPRSDAEVFDDYFEVPVAFDRPRTEVVFDRSYLDLRMPLANPHTKQAVTRQCEFIRNALLSRTGIVASVRTHLLRHRDFAAGLDATAKQLYFTPRTLRRRLRESGTTYREVVDDVRRALAQELMAQPTFTKHEIAEQLGYYDLSSFLRALRRWNLGDEHNKADSVPLLLHP